MDWTSAFVEEAARAVRASPDAHVKKVQEIVGQGAFATACLDRFSSAEQVGGCVDDYVHGATEWFLDGVLPKMDSGALVGLRLPGAKAETNDVEFRTVLMLPCKHPWVHRPSVGRGYERRKATPCSAHTAGQRWMREEA